MFFLRRIQDRIHTHDLEYFKRSVTVTQGPRIHGYELCLLVRWGGFSRPHCRSAARLRWQPDHLHFTSMKSRSGASEFLVVQQSSGTSTYVALHSPSPPTTKSFHLRSTGCPMNTWNLTFRRYGTICPEWLIRTVWINLIFDTCDKNLCRRFSVKANNLWHFHNIN
jgi:hypothetical protein